jgi:hypothetical protein
MKSAGTVYAFYLPVIRDYMFVISYPPMFDRDELQICDEHSGLSSQWR